LLPYPGFSLAYTGLGDLFVFLYFGFVAVLMIPYLILIRYKIDAIALAGDGTKDMITPSTQQQQSLSVWWQLVTTTAVGRYAIQVGLLGVNIIVVNNLRDRHTDAISHKRTTAVRFGRKFSLVEYIVCLVVTYALVIVDTMAHIQRLQRWATQPNMDLPHDNHHYGHHSILGYLRLLPLLSIPAALREMRAVCRTDGAALNPHVGGAALVQLLFCLLLAAAIFLSPSPPASTFMSIATKTIPCDG
jgi:1,4-dihydroxy-2-naphthoate polyprenyltransferase